MTDAEIIKALECHNICRISKCEQCPLFPTNECSAELSGYALDLINRQKAEIERLEEQVNLWQEEAGSVGCANEWLKASLENARAEAIKECLDKFDIEYCKMFSIPEIEFMKAFKRHFLKEMVGDTE